jgi:serine protease Do
MKSITAALIAAGVMATGAVGAVNWNSAESPAPAGTGQNAQIAPMTTPNYRAIVQKFGPAVVGIDTEGTVKTGGPDSGNDPDFQGMPGFRGQMPRGGGERLVHGKGSGFIIGKDGIILTNAHVVRDASEVVVKLSDRREYKAKVLGSDPSTDVAVLKINANNLPVVSLGNPNQLSVGDYVLAIGSPFGFEQSATAGIVSAKSRSLPGDAYVPFIQTDVAVNPGNSGGPLFDAGGNVVGINSQIYSRTGGYQGVSFAIPIDVALRVKDQIVATGKVSHARLGVTVQEVNQSLAESFNLKQPEGALVSSVLPGSAGAKAGLQQGDVILKYNGQPINQSGDLPAQVGMAKPGDKATMEVWRNGKQISLTATLQGAKDAVAANDEAGQASTPKLGVAVRPLTPEERRESNLSAGLVVEQSTGIAERSGIEPGDIIVAVNGNAVKSVEDLKKIVTGKASHIALLIQRGDQKIFVPVTLG